MEFRVGDKVMFSERMRIHKHKPLVEFDNKIREIIGFNYCNDSIVLSELPNNCFASDELILAEETINNRIKIKNIVANKETTVIFFDDGDKIIVKRAKDEYHNPEVAILYAYFIKSNGLSKTQAKKRLQELVNDIHIQGVKK